VAFIKTGFQVFLKENKLEYDSISALMGLMLLPWTLKFLWAPMVDRVRFHTRAHRKSWIIPLQILGAGLLVVVAFLEPESQLMAICLFFLLYSFFCATQDIAVDGLAVIVLNKREHGAGNSMQMGGYYLGELLGGAVLLILLGLYGWTVAILTLAFLFLLPLLPLIPFHEPQCLVDKDERASLKTIKNWFGKSEKFWALLLVLYTGNQVLARTLLPSLLTEMNYTAVETGKIIGIWGNGASLIGALLGGLLINKVGRKNSIVYYGLLKLVGFSALFFLADAQASRGQVLSVILFNDFCAGLCTVALYTVIMDKCSLNRPGTDFTIQASINTFGILFFVILAGVIVKHLGFGWLFGIALLIGVISLLIAIKGIRWKEVEVPQSMPAPHHIKED
jgi:MFS family permease